MQSLEDVGDGLVEFCIWLVTHIPQILVLVIVIAVIILIIRAIIKGGKKRKAKKLAKMQALYEANAHTQLTPEEKVEDGNKQ